MTFLDVDTGYLLRLSHGMRKRGIIPRIAHNGIESKERLGYHRWAVEGTFVSLRAIGDFAFVRKISVLRPGSLVRSYPGDSFIDRLCGHLMRTEWRC